MGISLLVGIIIGFERACQHKSAGIRTYSLVCIGSTLFMLISAYGLGIGQNTNGFRIDPGRVAAQIVSGIGFLGAGVIIKERGHVIGLTTAAELWVTAGLGMAIGVGQYFLTLVGVVSVFLALYSTPFLVKCRLLPSYEEVDPAGKTTRQDCSQ
jgi:putative Mg2+ transporter-C (MgtC) family protein